MADSGDSSTSGIDGRPASPPVKTQRQGKQRPKKARPARAKRTIPRRRRSEPTAARAAKLALNLVEFEKTTISNAAALLQSINERSDKAIRHAMASAKWMPKEAQQIVDEWQRTVRHSLKDLSKSVNKSFDLVSKYLARVQAEAAPKEK